MGCAPYDRSVDDSHLRHQAGHYSRFSFMYGAFCCVPLGDANKLQSDGHRSEVGQCLDERRRIGQSTPAPSMDTIRRQLGKLDIEAKGKRMEEVAAPQRR